MRIALATCKSHPGFCANDDAPLLEAFLAQGADAQLICWDDETTDWSAFDAVIIRTTWDYSDRLDEYLAWVDHAHNVARLINPPDIVRANLDKTYLRDLERAGVPIVPTRWIEPHESDDLRAILRATGWPELIIKPVVGAGASGLGRFTIDQLDEAAAHTSAQLQRGVVMAQPLLESIRTTGETSIVLLDGEYSHAVRKVPAPGDIRVQIEFGGRYTLVDPAPEAIDIAIGAHNHTAGAHAPLLYCRADLVEPTPGDHRIIEFEAVEPELFFPMAPRSAERFARLALRRLAAV
ncbi:MAG: hypothetical protein H6813_06165 [Phycisphaeraceae bacterium]|nr:hypothetical protein [Phycisphaeraceae bacterium]MCB9848055.1 hypothetical protein [Phycisphaeraceae bacterium]